MKRNLIKTFATAGAAALLLAACGDDGGSSADDGSGSDKSQDPVYAEIASWNACEVLDNLQPITDYMGIVGWGGTTAEGGEPGNSEIGNTLDPDSIGCNGLINLGKSEGAASGGEIQVAIIPTEGEEQSISTFEERVSAATSEGASEPEFEETEFGDPWDQGVLYSWLGNGMAESPNTQIIARDGQWLLQIELNYSADLGLRNTGEPSYQFTEDELHGWFVETYLPEINDIINSRITEVQ